MKLHLLLDLCIAGAVMTSRHFHDVKTDSMLFAVKSRQMSMWAHRMEWNGASTALAMCSTSVCFLFLTLKPQ